MYKCRIKECRKTVEYTSVRLKSVRRLKMYKYIGVRCTYVGLRSVGRLIRPIRPKYVQVYWCRIKECRKTVQV